MEDIGLICTTFVEVSRLMLLFEIGIQLLDVLARELSAGAALEVLGDFATRQSHRTPVTRLIREHHFEAVAETLHGITADTEMAVVILDGIALIIGEVATPKDIILREAAGVVATGVDLIDGLRIQLEMIEIGGKLNLILHVYTDEASAASLVHQHLRGVARGDERRQALAHLHVGPPRLPGAHITVRSYNIFSNYPNFRQKNFQEIH